MKPEIENADKLLNRFGFFPVFHDGEVLSIVFDRDSLTATFGVIIPEFKHGNYSGNVEVVLEFFDIEEVRLEGFNYQNVISTFTFEAAFQRSEYSKSELPRILVELNTLFGVCATFSCSKINVQNVASTSVDLGRPPYLRHDNQGIGNERL